MAEFKKFSLKNRAQSFVHAWHGIKWLVKSQHNAWLHVLASFTVVGAAFYVHLGRSDWMIILIVMGMVWVAEALNTAIEIIGDAQTLARHPLIGRAKDVAAGGVLLSAILAFIVGLMVFWPYI
jgi:diacylglycerol kinase (ATP)